MEHREGNLLKPVVALPRRSISPLLQQVLSTARRNRIPGYLELLTVLSNNRPQVQRTRRRINHIPDYVPVKHPVSPANLATRNHVVGRNLNTLHKLERARPRSDPLVLLLGQRVHQVHPARRGGNSHSFPLSNPRERTSKLSNATTVLGINIHNKNPTRTVAPKLVARRVDRCNRLAR